MRRRHRMPFGAELREDGRVRFRLWAPGAGCVELCLEPATGTTLLPMTAEEEGWFTLDTALATAGSRYLYLIDGELRVPDPASRFQPEDVQGPSQVLDPEAWQWRDGGWRGRPWEEAVIYELHVGAFTAEGDFAAVRRRLDYLVDLGVTAVELMPVADFPGARNWGYDGVLPFAPDSRYGAPGDLKDLIQTAHQKGLMVFLDVVYNHFGPEGNYLHAYAPQFFTGHHRTPWGAAMNFDGPASETVRQFFIHNALYWLEEYRLDGLRLDAVHAIQDDSSPDILQELSAAVNQGPGRERPVYLILENDRNAAHYLRRDDHNRPRQYVAQWNDDIHHALHVLLTGESDGYYADYDGCPVLHLGRCLAQGFAYQGEPSVYRDGALRGEPSGKLPPTAFVSFLQNHDQVGNRAHGERIAALAGREPLRTALAVLLLAPSPPLLFMGEEFAARTPFQYFCDFSGELAAAITAGRRREFARFERYADPVARQAIPDPNASETFEHCKLDWESLAEPPHGEWLEFYRSLLALRRREIFPRLFGARGGESEFYPLGKTGLRVHWRMGDGSGLILLANLGADPLAVTGAFLPSGDPLYACPEETAGGLAAHRMPPWSAAWFLDEVPA